MNHPTRSLLVSILLFAGLIVGISSCKDSSTSNEPNQTPTVTFSLTPTEGIMPHEVSVSVDGNDSDGEIARYHFDADGDGTAEITHSSPIDQTYTYEQEGAYQAKAWVSDDEGANSSKQNVQVTVESGAPEITMTVTPTEGLEPLEVNIKLTSQDPTGDFDFFEVDFGRGDGVEQIPASEIDTSLTYDQSATIVARGIDQAGNESSEQTSEINVTPTHQVTLKLRNLTQDGEPFVTTGQTTFTIGEEQVTVDGGQITQTIPEGQHEINAIHPDYYEEWTFIREEGMSLTQMPIEQRDTKDTSSPVMISEDVTLELYKSNRNDLENLSKPYGDAVTGRDFYNMEDVGLILDRRQEPGTERYILDDGESITVWINTNESNSQPTSEIKNTIEEWVTTTSGASAHAFTQGYLGPHNLTLKEGGGRPNGTHIEIIYDNTISRDGLHGEDMEDENNPNRITFSIVRLNPDKATRGVTLGELTQTIGARSDIVNRLEPDLTGKESNEYADEYGEFGIILGKFLYTVPEGTNYEPEGVTW